MDGDGRTDMYMTHYAVHAPFNSDPRFAAHDRDRGKGPAAQAYATLIEGMDKSLGDVMDHLEAMVRDLESMDAVYPLKDG